VGDHRKRKISSTRKLIQRSVIDDHVQCLGLQQTQGIVAAWRRSAAEMEHSLMAARRDADWARVAQIAHSLKGASRHVGLVALTDAAAALERTARDKASLSATDVEAIETLLKSSTAALEIVWAERAGA
jgi:HPt (histidine-containing phosphotransfer) domain-containing protein